MASSKRERELARMRAERQAARRAAAAAARAKRRNSLLMGVTALAIGGIVLVVALVTSNGKSSKSALSSPTPTATPSPTPTAAPGVCPYTPSGTSSRPIVGLPSPNGPATRTAKRVVMKTNRGEIDLSLATAKAPCTVNSFTFLAAQKYFDNTKCHRLTTSGIYVLQCGDPTGTGSGGPGYRFIDENLTGLGVPNAAGTVTYPRGTVAMANAGPGTNGSQFFLVYRNSPLPPNYTPFGTITKGLDVLDTVARAGATPVGDGAPNLKVTITTFRVLA